MLSTNIIIVNICCRNVHSTGWTTDCLRNLQRQGFFKFTIFTHFIRPKRNDKGSSGLPGLTGLAGAAGLPGQKDMTGQVNGGTVYVRWGYYQCQSTAQFVYL